MKDFAKARFNDLSATMRQFSVDSFCEQEASTHQLSLMYTSLGCRHFSSVPAAKRARGYRYFIAHTSVAESVLHL